MIATSTENLIAQIANLSANEMMYLVAEANKMNDAKIRNLIASTVASDIQSHIDTAEDVLIICPECGSVHYKKNGKRNGIQRYACKDCGHRFTSLSNTILEKTYYSWDVWVAVIQAMMNGISLKKTIQVLKDDYHCTDVEENTVWTMRMKVMYAIKQMKSPTLSGIVQFDDTYLRENQKASNNLVSPFPSDFAYEREPRYGEVRSVLGIRGNEFATVSCAIDMTGHAVCRVLGMGTISPDVVYDFIAEHTDGIAYACSDADKTYKEVFKAMNIPHYVKPSTYLDTIRKAGYETPSRTNKETAEKQSSRNKVILEKMWKNGTTDKILNRGEMSYEEFCELKSANSLSLGRVNELHNELKLMLQKNTTGVSTKHLPFYVAWFEYLHNLKVDTDQKATSKKTAEKILIDILNTRVNITKAEIFAIGKNELQLPKASNQYMRLLNEKTEQMKEALEDKWFQFSDEDAFNSFKVRETMRSMPMNKLRVLGKKFAIARYTRLTKHALISELEGCEDIGKEVLMMCIDRQQHEKVKAAKSAEKKANKHSNRVVHKATFQPRMFSSDFSVNKKIVFIDTETTGLNKQYDEVLSLAVVNMDGEVLYDSLFKPRHKKHWREAQAINDISPAMVMGKPHITDEKANIEDILADADLICGWNIRYDLDMLHAAGIDLPKDDGQYMDMMRVFADAWNKKMGDKKPKKLKLADACKLLKIKHKKAHTAIGDTAVLIPIAEWLMAA